jgi:hypothetical protein
VIRTVVAATVPDESAAPCAVTHLPTCTDVDVVDASVMIFVLVPAVTVLFVVALASAPNCRAAITSVEPDNETTLPAAIDPTCGRFVRVPDGNPDGRCPDGKPDGRCPPPPPPNPVHVPFVEASSVSVLAVNEVAESDVPDGATAVTQSPALIAASVVVTWWLNFVDDVQATATWPDCGFCTCMVVPSTAATVPDAAGPRCPAPPLGAPVPPPPAGELPVLPGLLGVPLPLAEDPLHELSVTAAARAATATPNAGRATENVMPFLSLAAQRVDG